MKKGVLINASLSKVVAELGHTDRLVVADAGLPIPRGVERIDLALCPGMPPFLDAVRTLLSEMKVQSAIIAEELEFNNPQIFQGLSTLLEGIPLQRLPHEQFKVETGTARAVVRTGEFTPYANVILIAGVVF